MSCSTQPTVLAQTVIAVITGVLVAAAAYWTVADTVPNWVVVLFAAAAGFIVSSGATFAYALWIRRRT